METENWKIALRLYEGHPIRALLLAYQLIAIKQSLRRGPKGIPEAIAGLDMAIDSLYSYTDFDRIGRKFYYLTIEGALKPEHEKRLRKLGVKM